MVIVIDKDIDILEFYVEILADFGLNGVPVRQPRVALEYLILHTEEVEFIIMELSCQQKHDGLFLAEAIYKLKKTPILLVTDEPLPPHLKRNLFYGILDKSESFKELTRLIRALQAKGPG